MNPGLAGWRRSWRELGQPAADEALYRRLLTCWSEPHRHYHTLQHLLECLALFDPVRTLSRHPGEIELALWFHDAVYDPTRDDNEERSAEWARACVLEAGLPSVVAARLHALVIATRHRVLGELLARSRLYSTEWAHSRFDRQARDNLARALARLSD